MIQILTGPIRSYKTTSLMYWADARTDCGGVLSPDVGGLRRLYHVRNKTSIPWQKPEATVDTDLVIGRFVFDDIAFQTAMTWLDQDATDQEVKYFILDEIGPLELKGRGWDPWLQRSLHSLQSKETILVVRDFLLEQVIRYYGLQEPQILHEIGEL